MTVLPEPGVSEASVIELGAMTPLFMKEGRGEILQNTDKIPLYPPL